MNKIGYIYIMTNKNKTTLYIGVTNNLCRRVYEHRNHLIKNSFTDKYNLEYCIYYEELPYFDLAIQREKELKKWNRQKKEDLINKKNPEWKVLVTENGFVREKVSFSQQVEEFLKELHENQQIPPFNRNDGTMNEQIPPVGRDDDAQCVNNEIPPFSRNDDSQCVNNEIPPFSRNDDSQCENNEIPPFSRNDDSQCENEEIPPVGRNDERLHGFIGGIGGGFAATYPSPLPLSEPVISSEARNLNTQTTVIPNGTQWSEETLPNSQTVRHSEQSEETNTIKRKQ